MLLKRLTYPKRLQGKACKQCNEVKAWAEEIIARQEDLIKVMATEKQILYHLFYKTVKHSLPKIASQIKNDRDKAKIMINLFGTNCFDDLDK